MGKKGDLGIMKCGIVVGARWTCVIISETSDVTGVL